MLSVPAESGTFLDRLALDRAFWLDVSLILGFSSVFGCAKLLGMKALWVKAEKRWGCIRLQLATKASVDLVERSPK